MRSINPLNVIIASTWVTATCISVLPADIATDFRWGYHPPQIIRWDDFYIRYFPSPNARYLFP